MRNRYLVTALLTIFALPFPPGAATTAKPSDARKKESILIGQLASLTGNNPGGKDNELGAAQAVAEINVAGGLLGRQIVLRVEDDQTRPAAAVAAFERLVDQGVSAVVGTSFSNASIAVIPSAERARIAYVSTGAAGAQVEPIHPYVFMTPLTGRAIAEQLLRYLKDNNLVRIAVGYDGDSMFAKDGWAKQKAMLDRYGIQLVAERAFKVDTQDFGPAIDGLAASGAQAVMVWATGPPAIGFAKQYAASGTGLPLFMSHGAASAAFVQAVGEAAEGITVTTSLAGVASQLPESEAQRVALAMTKPYEKTNGHPPSQFAIDGYVAVKLIAAAIGRAGSDDPQAIQAALEHLTLLTPQGTYRYTPQDHAGLLVDDVAVTQIRKGAFQLTEWSKERIAARTP